MSKKAEQILSRYLRGYVTEEQLLRYRDIGAISQEEYAIIYAEKHPEPNTSEEVVE